MTVEFKPLNAYHNGVGREKTDMKKADTESAKRLKEDIDYEDFRT